ncbi:hypothetical protein B0F90DRAFT_929092 [Multifurca ochricompacta]|uniref:BTB domain-containing protein n=1 Tax=Multifurca ochricompacta TaxID=376703 RepID=A0AAD4MAX5_9AGAM|nr:hypothetical protein B0F90DRAFT_929092 [Multifurca ochricompacta]
MSMCPEEHPPSAFGAPFDDDDADVILRSSDKVDFYVYRSILSKASPVFKIMFSLRQPSGTSKNQHSVVDLTEKGSVVAALLMSIYPAVSLSTEPKTFADAIAVLMAAQKYDMATVFRNDASLRIIRENPVEAFCALYSPHQDMGEAACKAAKASLEHPLELDAIGDKLKYTNGYALHRLWKYHRACSEAAIVPISTTDLSWITPEQSDLRELVYTRGVSTHRNSNCDLHLVAVGGKTWQWNTLWLSYMERARAAVGKRPCGEAVSHPDVLKPSYVFTKCRGCHNSILGLMEFSHYLEEEIDRRVSKVQL